ncbi:cation diffusion facilitator family transporter [Dongia sedimenti]|uniref:Cation diffusion facilitator family transporter n=1 Tax=Dongia sedimenti TaxID=3064282 RepID=A0ABU0YTB2_9PROT|nr:cation diffusion facilitator family transporter [Rhodospirillaceae bacterium R-7]
MAVTPASARLMRAAGLASVGVAAVLIAIKLYAYVATNSVSMLSSLFDSALDLGASMVNLLAIRTAVTPADAEHRFGHGKAEPLAGLIQVAFILGSSLLLLFEVGKHFLERQAVQQETVGIFVMLISIALTMALILFQRHVIRRTDSMAVQADSAHYLSDFLANIAVIVALVLSSLFGWWWIDPLFGLLVAIFIAYTALTIGRTSLDMLMDREMDTAEREKIKAIVRDHPEVLNLHDLRTRIAGKDRFIQFHLELSPEISLKEAHRISDAVEAQVIEAFPEAEVIIHQDPYGAADRPSPRFG